MPFLSAKGAAALASVALFAVLGWFTWRRFTRRAAITAVRKFRARVDRFKLTTKAYISEALLADETVAAAVRAHAAEHGMSEAAVWQRVRTYVREIVPVFNLLAYYEYGISLSRGLLHLFYRTDVRHVRRAAFDALPRESIVIYLLNHRSNADYVFSGYALAGQVAISYAVGEWARVFPLEYIFKSFGSYFIRRRYREALYHTVLERYVQLITRNGVTQGIFPEGGLTRDGTLRPAKIGLFDYILGVAREPGFAERMYVVPVAINYDRVLEDRSLLRELRVKEGDRPSGRVAQLREVMSYFVWNVWRMVFRRFKRYGTAAIVIGEPAPLKPWLDALAARGTPLFTLERSERLAEVQGLVDGMMQRIGAIIPVTPVPLVCAALQTFESEFVTRKALVDRIDEMRASLLHHGHIVLDPAEPVADTLDRAYDLLHMRRVIAREGVSYAILPRGRELISYYANSVAHLLGEFEQAVRRRDVLPMDLLMK
ncbi:MAG: 1-acyl-sn-glycerol-3-phosphate acyltransferase [Gemmatimonadetes bacterium]|nr:1-acyl-sn-glycerol-3-phosphate acyltransferase [Gemmatimonadota bacterium]MBI3568307.1 1-acyl-sn-glycerol-3-phosphate acyltransferase [Gemmatimonadota bacterium]